MLFFQTCGLAHVDIYFQMRTSVTYFTRAVISVKRKRLVTSVAVMLVSSSAQIIKPALVSLYQSVIYYTPPQTLFVVDILFSRCPCVRVCVRASVCASVRPPVTFCFLKILKSHCWIFIKPCKHVHICKTNTLDKKVRARGQFY